jgi:hypothetical protein
MPSVSVASIALLLADANSTFSSDVFASRRHLEERLQRSGNISHTDFRIQARRTDSFEANVYFRRIFHGRMQARQTELGRHVCRDPPLQSLRWEALGKVQVFVRFVFFKLLEPTHRSPTQQQTEPTCNMGPSSENRSAGGSSPNNLSEFRSDTSKDDDPKRDTGVSSSSYAISSHGETPDLRGALALRPYHEGSTGTGKGKSSGEDRKGQDEKSEQEQPTIGEEGEPSGNKSMSDEHETGTNADGTKSEPKVMKEYSAEARTYHAFHDEVRRPRLYFSQDMLLTLQSFNALTSGATTRGAAKIA